MAKRLLIYLLCFLIVAKSALAGTAYYCDLSDPGVDSNSNGSWGDPFVSLLEVNNHSFSTGDDLYFKVNTHYNVANDNDRLNISWAGTSGDHVIIGVYYGDGLFGLNGNSRPVIDGNDTYPTGQWDGLVYSSGSAEYFELRDFRVEASNAKGIILQNNGLNNVWIYNIYTYYNYNQGISTWGDTGYVENSVFEGNCSANTGAQLEITAGYQGATRGRNWLVQNSVFFNGDQEGIGFYKDANNNIVENCLFYDHDSYTIYISDGPSNNIARYNMVIYTTSNPYSPMSGNERGIIISCENAQCGDLSTCADNNKVYGNLVAGAYYGIQISTGATCDSMGLNPTNNKIYGNTVVDSHVYNFYLYNAGTGNEIKNNISWTLSGGSTHANAYSPSGVTWSHNLFDDSVSGNAANNAVIGTPGLSKTSGWQAIVSGTVTGTQFALTPSSDAIGAGTNLGAPYDEGIDPNNVDFTATPIFVSLLSQESSWDIGAMISALSTFVDHGRTQVVGVKILGGTLN